MDDLGDAAGRHFRVFRLNRIELDRIIVLCAFESKKSIILTDCEEGEKGVYLAQCRAPQFGGY